MIFLDETLQLFICIKGVLHGGETWGVYVTFTVHICTSFVPQSPLNTPYKSRILMRSQGLSSYMCLLLSGYRDVPNSRGRRVP
jgi:hypothetical protein